MNSTGIAWGSCLTLRHYAFDSSKKSGRRSQVLGLRAWESVMRHWWVSSAAAATAVISEWCRMPLACRQCGVPCMHARYAEPGIYHLRSYECWEVLTFLCATTPFNSVIKLFA